MKRTHWTLAERKTLRDRYPTTNTTALAAELGRSAPSVNAKARGEGLKKCPAYLSDPSKSARLDGKRGSTTRFTRGHATWNKGMKGFVCFGRSAETHFKPGRAVHEARNYVPIGTYRINHEGYLEQKVNDDKSIAPCRRWVAVHRLVWQAAHGPIPATHAVCFLPGRRSKELAHITLDSIELVTRGELMRRNSVHTNYPPEICALVQLRGALNRKIANRTTK